MRIQNIYIYILIMFGRRNTKRNDSVFSSCLYGLRHDVTLFYVNLYYFYLFQQHAEAHNARQTATDLFLTFGIVFDSKGDE